MTTPIGIDPIDARRLVLDGLLDGLPRDAGYRPGRVVVASSSLLDHAGDLVSSLRPGDPPRRLAVVADVPLGALVSTIASFDGYVGAAAVIEVVELASAPDRATARAVLDAGAVPFFPGDVGAVTSVRDDLGATVGLLGEPADVVSVASHDLALRIPARLPWVAEADGPGIINVIAATAMALDGGSREEVTAALSASDIALERRRLRWEDAVIGLASLRAARTRLDGLRAPEALPLE